MYQGYREMKEMNSELKVPQFLGVQQEAVCPFVERLGTLPEGRDPHVPILEPTLFRSNPTPDLVEFVKNILGDFGGDVKAILNTEYASYEATCIAFFQKLGIDLSIQLSEQGQPMLLEKAGLIALAGALQNIDRGLIREGETVLVAVTGGSR